MSTYRSGDATMRAYAQERAQDADQILAAHRRDGAGCCVACGRPAPCNDLVQAAALREHYRGWLDGARVWVDGAHAAAQIRPYLSVRLGHGDPQR